MSKTYSLIVSAPDSDPVQFRLSDERVDLGRAGSNDISLENKSVSKRHCRFIRTDSGGYRLLDVGSTNGTRVNGQKVMNSDGIPLKNGDRLLFGEAVEAQFIEAVNGKVRNRDDDRYSDGEVGWIPQPAWARPNHEPIREEEINPVAAAIARQQGLTGRGD